MTLPNNITIEVFKSAKRKRSISLQLQVDKLVVRAPLRCKDSEIEDLIEKRADWIKKKLKEIEQRPKAIPQSFSDGSCLLVGGELVTLRLKEAKKIASRLENSELTLEMPALLLNQDAKVKQHLILWYKSYAQSRLESRTMHYAGLIGVKPSGIVVKSYKARWGACSISGELFYNWKIIMAPEAIMDYVVVHELCHILEHNHSKKFWHHVERHYPSWREAKQWFKDHPLDF